MTAAFKPIIPYAVYGRAAHPAIPDHNKLKEIVLVSRLKDSTAGEAIACLKDAVDKIDGQFRAAEASSDDQVTIEVASPLEQFLFDHAAFTRYLASKYDTLMDGLAEEALQLGAVPDDADRVWGIDMAYSLVPAAMIGKGKQAKHDYVWYLGAIHDVDLVDQGLGMQWRLTLSFPDSGLILREDMDKMLGYGTDSSRVVTVSTRDYDPAVAFDVAGIAYEHLSTIDDFLKLEDHSKYGVNGIAIEVAGRLYARIKSRQIMGAIAASMAQAPEEGTTSAPADPLAGPTFVSFADPQNKGGKGGRFN